MRVLVLLVEFGGSLCVTYIDFLEVKGKGYLYCDQIKNKNIKSRKNTMLRCVSASKVCLSNEKDTVQQCWDNLPCEWVLIKMSKRPAPVTTEISQYYSR